MADSNTDKIATSPAPLDRQLCFALYSASLAMTQIYKPLLKPLGLTYPQYLIMLILWEKDGRTLKEIGAQLGQKSGALTPVLKRMEQDGLLERVRDEGDERALNIRLTENGWALRAKAANVGNSVLGACNVPIEGLVDLHTQLVQLRDNLTDAIAAMPVE
nr:MarR family transcriptional regulator [uncultured Cohaesibacter sp.]